MTPAVHHEPDAADPRPERFGRRFLSSEGTQAVLVAVVAVVLLGCRAPVATHQFWAEDGARFFQDALVHGPFEPFMTSYAGYFNLLPRLIAAVSLAVPLRAAATATWVLTALVIGWCVATVFLNTRPWLVRFPTRATLAIGLVLLPSLGTESIGSSSNLQFTLLFAAMIVLLGSSQRRCVRVSNCALLAAAGLSSLLIVFLLPFALWRVLRRRPRRPDAEVVAWVVGLSGQLLAIVVLGADRGSSGSAALATTGRGYLERVVYQNLSPVDWWPAVGGLLVMLVVAGIVIAGATLSWRAGDRERGVLFAAVPVFGAGVYAAASLRSVDGMLAARYELNPAWCLVWSILVSAEVLAGLWAGGRRTTTWQVGVTSAVCLVLVASWLPHWRPSAFRTSGLTWGQGLDGAVVQCEGPTETGGVAILPTGMAVVVECVDLG